MIQLTKGSKNFHIFFDIDLDSQDFTNIKVRDSEGEITPSLYEKELETIKDLIAEEILLAELEARAEQFKTNTFVKN
jgi:hypothetical protein